MRFPQLHRNLEDFFLSPHERYSAERLQLEEKPFSELLDGQANHSRHAAVNYGAIGLAHAVGSLIPAFPFYILTKNFGLPNPDNMGRPEIAHLFLGTMTCYALFGAAYFAIRAKSLFTFANECEHARAQSLESNS